ncbi:MAG: hypothetical protein LBH82_00830 [Bacteroidales bacterium]|jgi:hypothetical protein|nr:hypothetical protein [Bacteroidales bacterium]
MRPAQIKIILSFILFAIAFYACGKFAKDVPAPIKKIIRKCPSCYSQVVEYEDRNSNVYLFIAPMDAGDALNVLYSENGVYMCTCGGFVEARCDTVYSNILKNATKNRIVWTKKGGKQ